MPELELMHSQNQYLINQFRELRTSIKYPNQMDIVHKTNNWAVQVTHTIKIFTSLMF